MLTLKEKCDAIDAELKKLDAYNKRIKNMIKRTRKIIKAL